MTSVEWVELAGIVIAREQLLELVDRLNGACAADTAAVLLIADATGDEHRAHDRRTARDPRPALALTAAEELETIRAVLLEAATSTTRETWATCTCPECGKGFRQEISVPDHGARIKAVEALLREGLGRVGEAHVLEPRVPTSVEELRTLSSEELELVVAVGYASEIRDVLDHGDDALRSKLESWEPETRATLARVLAQVA